MGVAGAGGGNGRCVSSSPASLGKSLANSKISRPSDFAIRGPWMCWKHWLWGRYSIFTTWTWYARRDSNPQHSEPESDALSIELRAHIFDAYSIAGFSFVVKGEFEKISRYSNFLVYFAACKIARYPCIFTHDLLHYTRLKQIAPLGGKGWNIVIWARYRKRIHKAKPSNKRAKMK